MSEHRLLTVRQPWARPIVDGHKTVENRASGFGTSYRGPLWIHAGAAWSDRGMTSPLVLDAYPLIFFTDGAGRPVEARTVLERNGFTLGAVLGRVQVVDAHHAAPGCCASPWAEASYVDASKVVHHDPVHLVLADPQALPLGDGPVVAGALGIWNANRHPGLDNTLDHLARELDQEAAPC